MHDGEGQFGPVICDQVSRCLPPDGGFLSWRDGSGDKGHWRNLCFGISISKCVSGKGMTDLDEAKYSSPLMVDWACGTYQPTKPASQSSFKLYITTLDSDSDYPTR
ncbi:hypothetical protein RRG08_027458 [Elysia crispata]|uniref:Uncharacterized protein n=1 Tax=Elysia crispata TaxID=231223 RepID=A0AAE0YRT4_9GAST|nr:hypothetical protein RRG08_027458 [Elysia crispata]